MQVVPRSQCVCDCGSVVHDVGDGGLHTLAGTRIAWNCRNVVLHRADYFAFVLSQHLVALRRSTLLVFLACVESRWTMSVFGRRFRRTGGAADDSCRLPGIALADVVTAHVAGGIVAWNLLRKAVALTSTTSAPWTVLDSFLVPGSTRGSLHPVDRGAWDWSVRWFRRFDTTVFYMQGDWQSILHALYSKCSVLHQ